MTESKAATSYQWNYHDLMLHRVHEILLVASPYDAYILEEDGRLTEQILTEYLGMNLSYAPRVWRAWSASSVGRSRDSTSAVPTMAPAYGPAISPAKKGPASERSAAL